MYHRQLNDAFWYSHPTKYANLDNAQLAQQRLILLDATLVFSMACAIWTYIRFYRHRHNPFSKPWWRWLIATGVALSFVMSTKYVGLFTFVTIGGAVAVDLWNLLDIRRGLPIVRPISSHLMILERIWTSFCGAIFVVDCSAVHHLSFLVLASFCDSYAFGTGR